MSDTVGKKAAVNLINQTIDSNNEQLFVKHGAIPPGRFAWKGFGA